MISTKQILSIGIVILLILGASPGCLESSKPAPATVQPYNPITTPTFIPTPVPNPEKQITFKELIPLSEKFKTMKTKYDSAVEKLYDLSHVSSDQIQNNPSSYINIKNELYENREEILILKKKYQQFALDNPWFKLISYDSMLNDRLFDKIMEEADKWYELEDYSQTGRTIGSFYSYCIIVQVVRGPARDLIENCPIGPPFNPEIIGRQDGRGFSYVFAIYNPEIISYSDGGDFYVVSTILGHKLKAKLIVPKESMDTDSIGDSINIESTKIYKLKQLSDYPEVYLYRDNKSSYYTYYEVVKIRDGLIYHKSPNPLEEVASPEIFKDYKEVEDALNVRLKTTALDD